ncbi:hypothetical protein [Paenibacillus protaetiae]|uniref:DUF1453 family protein n=1 Tax=Paenibacillus protaetiae TaxID=2509456 RepID=A0A4P6EUB0_9BACL|nr:hypothetical protein [Paenibacillus protaetiae]QAY66514.1 hypothetical protein ET464_08910 [Paenibacillus protaetiae]
MTTSTWISTIIIFLALVLTSVGKREFRMFRLLLPLGILAYYGATYMQDVPTDGNNMLLLIVSVVIGLALGFILLKFTKVERDAGTGKIYVIVGAGSVIIWVAAFLFRIIPIEWMTHHPKQTYQFALDHQINLDIIGPAFIIMTLAMVIVRVSGIRRRVKSAAAAQRQL